MKTTYRIATFKAIQILFEKPMIVTDNNGIKRQIDEAICRGINESGKTARFLLRNGDMNITVKNYKISYLSGIMFVKLNGTDYRIGTYKEA